MKIFEALEREWNDAEGWAAARIPHHAADAAPQTPAPGPVTLAAAPPEEITVSKIADDLRAFASRIENLGDDAAADLEKVQANPETAKVFTALKTLTGLNVAPGIIGIVAAGLDELVSRLQAAVPPETATSAPAGPSVAGQA